MHMLLSNVLILVSIRIPHCCFYNGLKAFVKLSASEHKMQSLYYLAVITLLC